MPHLKADARDEFTTWLSSITKNAETPTSDGHKLAVTEIGSSDAAGRGAHAPSAASYKGAAIRAADADDKEEELEGEVDQYGNKIKPDVFRVQVIGSAIVKGSVKAKNTANDLIVSTIATILSPEDPDAGKETAAKAVKGLPNTPIDVSFDASKFEAEDLRIMLEDAGAKVSVSKSKDLFE